MDYVVLESIIRNFDTPACISNCSGDILSENYHFKYVRDLMITSNLENMRSIEFLVDDSDYEDIKKFRIGGTSLRGNEYTVKTDDGQEYKLYIFKRNFSSERLINQLIEHIDEIVVIFDENGVLQKMNAICDQLLPFKREDVIGKSINHLVAKGIVKEPIIKKMIETRMKVFKDISYSNGRVISYTAVPIFGLSGNFKGGVLTGRDASRMMNIAKKGMDTNIAVVDEYISDSEEIQKIKGIIKRVAPSDAPVFIIGESGVGKEIMAKNIWNNSSRSEKPFLAINCATIPSELVESELFGYEKGAFTGANKEGKKGIIEAADGGTLFLDEIGELPLEVQKKFLRVIQEKSIMRIGSLKSKKIDVRYICATNLTMEDLKNPKIFRQDLYYRLGVIPLLIPPLRERREDILPIARFYVNYFNKQYNRNIFLSIEAQRLLYNNDWKGNIRELRNVIERLVILSAKEEIYSEQVKRVLNLGNESQIEAIQNADKMSAENNIGNFSGKIVIDNNMNIDDAHRLVEQEILKNALKKHGNITDAAKSVGINPSTVYRKIKSGYIDLGI